MRKGDIFRWSFKNPKDFMPYHCCSQIAVFDGEILKDTYWGSLSSGRHWTPSKAEADLDLTFVANFDDLEEADPSVYDYYDRADIVDLRHPNNSSRSNVYLRKGAKRSAAAMRETLQHTIDRSRSEIEMAERRIEQCLASLAKVDAGELDGHYVISYRDR